MEANGDPLAIERTRVACAGAATAFLVRNLGARAGGYAPGIQDRFLRELGTETDGADLPRVARWFAGRAAELARLGNRMGARMVAFRTATILQWVTDGKGHRGAVLVTYGELLHPGAGIQAPHAIAVASDANRRSSRAELTAFDPWPGIERTSPPPTSLEQAHRRCLHRAFLLYSYGWS